MLSPAIAALVGAGLVALWQDYRIACDATRTRPWKGWLLPPALLLTAIIETRILAPFNAWASRLTPLVLGLALLAGLGLVVDRLYQPGSRLPALGRLQKGLLLLGIAALLLAPFVWSLTPLWFGGDAALPYAGPGLQRQSPGPQPPAAGGKGQALPVNLPPRQDRLSASHSLAEYLLAQQAGEHFLAATLNANEAAPLILLTGQPVMALGGFSGSDSILSPIELAEMVAAGEVRFFLLAGQGQQAELSKWVTQHCASVPQAAWSGTQATPAPLAGSAPPGGPNAAVQLYNCRP
jgi:hypothetical protein